MTQNANSVPVRDLNRGARLRRITERRIDEDDIRAMLSACIKLLLSIKKDTAYSARNLVVDEHKGAASQIKICGPRLIQYERVCKLMQENPDQLPFHVCKRVLKEITAPGGYTTPVALLRYYADHCLEG